MAYLAQGIEGALGKITLPESIRALGEGAQGINRVLTVAVEVIFAVAAITFVFMVVISAFSWISSGGDKEKLEKARARLTHAIIGIALLSLSFLMLRIFGDILGFPFFKAN